ncbi:MAG: HemK2/MTQ2 family protein methyltransferase [Actinomycetota bacterium]
MSADEAERLRRWHERASEELHALGGRRVSYLDLDLEVPAEVLGPSPVSDLLGERVLAEVEPDERVLDLGTGSGVNALLAARKGATVVGVDINPVAVEVARRNAVTNGLHELATFVEGDLFDPVDGTFDVIVFDPPFRWFAPRDLLEMAFADDGYATLTRFFAEVPERLRPGGRVLLFFGTSGDIAYLRELMAASPFDSEVVATRMIDTANGQADYFTYRLTLD